MEPHDFNILKNPYRLLNNILSSGSDPSEPLIQETENTEATTNTSLEDMCELGDGTPVDASEVCNKIAPIEGNGKYTQQHGASFSQAAGRYQFVGSTAVGEIKKLGYASTDEQARALWSRCRTSASPDCKKLQDAMCNSYSEYIIRSLKNRGYEPTMRNIYLAWNQGVGGASVILEAAKNGTEVTDANISSNMKNQAWTKTNNARAFLNGMEDYMNSRGVTP